MPWIPWGVDIDSFKNSGMELSISWPTWRASFYAKYCYPLFFTIRGRAQGWRKGKVSHIHQGKDLVQISHEIPALLNSHIFSQLIFCQKLSMAYINNSRSDINSDDNIVFLCPYSIFLFWNHRINDRILLTHWAFILPTSWS